MSHCILLLTFIFLIIFHINSLLNLIEGNIKKQEVGCESSCDSHNDVGSCNKNDSKIDHAKLFRWDPVKVGYEREIEMGQGRKLIMVTKAINPPVFIVDGYLEDYECDHLINKSKSLGLYSSELHIDPKTLKAKEYNKYNLSDYSKYFDNVDYNRDGKINLPLELKNMAYSINHLYINDTEVEDIVEKFEMIVNEDETGRYITRENYNKINSGGLHEYLIDLREKHPHHRDRFSEQIWIPVHNADDKIIDKIMERLQIVTQLHRDIVYGTEPIQVVKYLPHGHYHAHFDSQDKANFPSFPCCHTMFGGNPNNCRICRYLTAMTYLNNVEKGGETTFPVADDPDFTHEEFLLRKKGDMYNLSQFCKNGTLVVNPKKGSLIFWYNHFVDENGMLGPLDTQSLHGGCDVIIGEKWIANNWIPAADSIDQVNNNVYRPHSIMNSDNEEKLSSKFEINTANNLDEL